MEDINGKTLKLREDLTLVSVEDSGALLDVEKRCYHDLNGTAFFIAGLLENGYPYSQIQKALTAEFSVDEKTAITDAANFIDELQRHGLLSIGEATVEFKEVSDIRHSIKPYQPPAFEYQKELATASGQVTTDTVI